MKGSITFFTPLGDSSQVSPLLSLQSYRSFGGPFYNCYPFSLGLIWNLIYHTFVHLGIEKDVCFHSACVCVCACFKPYFHLDGINESFSKFSICCLEKSGITAFSNLINIRFQLLFYLATHFILNLKQVSFSFQGTK